MVFIKLRETYDLSTKKDKMTMIGIHTPSINWLVRQYYGLFLNCKKFRFVSANVTCACASTLPADPAQIGTDATDIAPQDMFNPILYRAVSNDSFDTLNARLYSLGYFGTTRGGSVDQAQETFSGVDNFALYYSILARPDGFRTASPQAGFQMTDLRPLVWEQLYTEQAPYSSPIDVTDVTGEEITTEEIGTPMINNSSLISSRVSRSVRGSAHPYPALPTFMAGKTAWTVGNAYQGAYGTQLSNVSATEYVNLPDTPTVFVGQILIPPSKLNLLYYRMVVEWTVEFTGIRPTSDIMTPGSMAIEGTAGNNLAYFTDYTVSSSTANVAAANTASLLSEDTSSLSAENANIELVMQA